MLSHHVLNIVYVFSLSYYGLNIYHDVVTVVHNSLVSCRIVILVVVLLCSISNNSSNNISSICIHGDVEY